ncbi:uncharacterized protein Tco025E_09913 [Trypanosoma conorhini]|uniref:Uncharacterized protein n=1 Tax=Trypanosoma conorhini TaxID=83891 RepID=A0A3R7LXY7_9TRYP|nr:uncharacterized protein Tco025E_09913 [Trypanosoma conorhini]RNE95774.1 hypothetical protein Tco025E_09913 [Trypanosoma conorhini]
MERLTYTREELLALRETLALDAFADPVPPDCPMRTDSDLTLLQTTVRKRKKEYPQLLPVLRRPAADTGAVGEAGCLTHVDNLRAGVGALSITMDNPNRAEEYADPEERGKRVLMPPRLQIPFVTIDAKRRSRNIAGVDHEERTEVNVDAERRMVARLRLRQQKRQAEQPLSSLVAGPPRHAGGPAGGVASATPPPTAADVASHGSCVRAAELAGLGTSALPHPETDTAVPILNFSLFNSAIGSRYLQFARYVGLWHYLFGALGPSHPHLFGHAAGAKLRGGDTNNSTTSRSPNGNESSIGLDDSGTTPAGGEKSDSEPVAASQESYAALKKKRPHRRRTNRTHAEKREHRQAQQLLLEQAGSGGCSR